MHEVWQLVISSDNDSWNILASEEALRVAVSYWQGWKLNVARDEEGLLTVVGFCDSADRAPLEIRVALRSITALTLFRKY